MRRRIVIAKEHNGMYMLESKDQNKTKITSYQAT